MLTERTYFIQFEHPSSNFWLLLETAASGTTPIDGRADQLSGKPWQASSRYER